MYLCVLVCTCVCVCVRRLSLKAQSSVCVYLCPLGVPELGLVACLLLLCPCQAAQVAHVAVGRASPAQLRVDLKEPALHIHVVGYQMGQRLMLLQHRGRE